MSVGQHHHFFLPSHALAGFQGLLHECREVVVSFSGFMLHISHRNRLVGKSSGQFLCRGKHSATVLPQIDDQSAARLKIEQDIVERARADGVGKTGACHIPDIIVEDAVSEPVGNAIVCSEIAVDERVAVIAGIVFVESPIASDVKRGIKIHVSVFQFCQHIAQHLEQLALGHAVVNLFGIAFVHVIPIDIFLLEEAIVLIHDFPQSLKVAFGVVGILCLGDTRAECHQQQ